MSGSTESAKTILTQGPLGCYRVGAWWQLFFLNHKNPLPDILAANGAIPYLLLFLAGIIVILGIPFVTIDHDEGFFYQTALGFVTHGEFDFPWTRVFLDGHSKFIPLNSLVPLLMTGPAMFHGQALWLGRTFSALAVLLGMFFLVQIIFLQEESRWLKFLTFLFLLVALPLWHVSRMIRPEAYVFLCTAALLWLTVCRPRCPVWVRGLVAGLACLAHGVQGPIVALLGAGLVFVSDGRPALKSLLKLSAYAIGLSVPIVFFYFFYAYDQGVIAAWMQLNLFLQITPVHGASSYPWRQFHAWIQFMRGQGNQWPIVILVLTCALIPLRGRHSQRLWMAKAIMVLFLTLWVLIYPKKSLSPVPILFPLAVFVLALNSFKAVPRWTYQIAIVGLATSLTLNLLISGRYHYRLWSHPVLAKGATDELASLLFSHIPSRPITILAKPWLIFSLRSHDELYDITIAPRAGKYLPGASAKVETLLDTIDAVILEWDGREGIDGNQDHLLRAYLKKRWPMYETNIWRYFGTQKLILFLNPVRFGAKSSEPLPPM